MQSEAVKFQGLSQLFNVTLPLFDGPIDLLLHLVKTNELPISKVSLAEVAEQYMQCLELMKSLDLDVAGEYLVIAATLLSIKSSFLLNEPVELVMDEEGNLYDPYEALLQQLREAEIYQDAAIALGRCDMLGVDVFEGPSLLHFVDAGPETLTKHDPVLLGKAFTRLLNKASERGVALTIQFDPVSIVERMMEVLKRLEEHDGPIVFHALVPDVTSKTSIVSTFCALLELCKRGAITVLQEESFDEIFIGLSGEKIDLTTLRSDFDKEEGEAQESEVNGAANA